MLFNNALLLSMFSNFTKLESGQSELNVSVLRTRSFYQHQIPIIIM